MSIVSAWYNREAWVGDSIKSLLSQSYDNVEIIVVDDGSTDRTLAELQSFRDKRLRVITQENQGFVRAIRRAISESRGEFVAIHGAGDISLPTRIEKQVNVLLQDDAIGIVGCHVQNVDIETGAVRVHAPKLNLPQALHRELMVKNLFTHGEVMFRRSLYDLVGGYREFFRFAQDRDLWLRMSEYAGGAIVPEVLYVRYGLPGGVSTSLAKRVLQAYLSEFAVECARERQLAGRDLLEDHGAYAVFYRRRSKRLAQRLMDVALSSVKKGDLAQAYRVITLSVDERRQFANSLLWFLMWISVDRKWFEGEQIRRLLISLRRFRRMVRMW